MVRLKAANIKSQSHHKVSYSVYYLLAMQKFILGVQLLRCFTRKAQICLLVEKNECACNMEAVHTQVSF